MVTLSSRSASSSSCCCEIKDVPRRHVLDGHLYLRRCGRLLWLLLSSGGLLLGRWCGQHGGRDDEMDGGTSGGTHDDGRLTHDLLAGRTETEGVLVELDGEISDGC